MIKPDAKIASIEENGDGTRKIVLTQFAGVLKLREFPTRTPYFVTHMSGLKVGETLPVRHVVGREVVIDYARLITGAPAPKPDGEKTIAEGLFWDRPDRPQRRVRRASRPRSVEAALSSWKGWADEQDKRNVVQDSPVVG